MVSSTRGKYKRFTVVEELIGACTVILSISIGYVWIVWLHLSSIISIYHSKLNSFKLDKVTISVLKGCLKPFCKQINQ